MQEQKTDFFGTIYELLKIASHVAHRRPPINPSPPSSLNARDPPRPVFAKCVYVSHGSVLALLHSPAIDVILGQRAYCRPVAASQSVAKGRVS